MLNSPMETGMFSVQPETNAENNYRKNLENKSAAVQETNRAPHAKNIYGVGRRHRH